MKLYFAAAAAIALFASAPSYATSVMSAGQGVAQDCSIAAKAGASLTERGRANGIAACDAALAGDLSQYGRAGTLVNRGIIQAAAGNSEAAIADFDAAIARQPDLAAGYMNRGAVFLRTGRYDQARADYDRAISLGTADAHVAYFNRGEAQEAMGNLLAAYHDYRRAQQLAPNFEPASLELARFQVTSRQVADSR
ncbi:MAG TPA: tetratricopeptide repeat protein [Rhizomicrobium sp.]|jgi:tetratricopeptide (TPR) repeat protein|nr:tetratricopeptide repeat protein [Rhizomicrobium sp.]